MNFQQNFIPQYNNGPFIQQQGFIQGGDMMMNGGNNMIGGNNTMSTNMMTNEVLNNITNIQQPMMTQTTQEIEYQKALLLQQQQQLQQQQIGMIQQQQTQNNVMTQQPYPTEPTTISEKMYTKYEDLPSLGNNFDVVSVVNTLKMYFENKSNWKSPFDALDNLRILNKYYPNELNNIVAMFWKYIVECIESPKTFIAKNALLFVTEVFMNSKNVRIHDDIIKGLVPHVLAKASSEKGFMKKEAQNALKELTVNCCYDITIMVLCTHTLDKNPAIGDIAILTLAQILNNIGANISKLNQLTLYGLARCLAKTLDMGKHAEQKKYATMICLFICKLFGLEDYARLIKGSNLSKGEELAMVQVVEKKKDTKRVENLQEFKTEKKRQARMSMMSQGISVPFNGGALFGMNENVNPNSQQMMFMQGGNSMGGFQQDFNNLGMQNMGGMINNTNTMYNFQSGGNIQNIGSEGGINFQRLF